MGCKRSPAGASVLALLGFLAVPVGVYFATTDPATAVVGGTVGAAAAAWLILHIGMTTQDCAGYHEGVARVLSGGDSGGQVGWWLAVTAAASLVGILARIWRSDNPIETALAVAGLLAGALAASVVLVIAVMAFGDLVDRVLRKRRG
jgi:hypothetical protein